MSNKINVTHSNAQIGMLVTRGRDWNYDNQDFFPGNVGVITKLDPTRRVVEVTWKSPDGRQSHMNTYRIYSAYDLYIYTPADSNYPEPYAVNIGSKVLINDPQGQNALETNKEYEVVDKHGQTLILLVGEEKVSFTAEGNSTGKYFKLLLDAPKSAPTRQEEIKEVKQAPLLPADPGRDYFSARPYNRTIKKA